MAIRIPRTDLTAAAMRKKLVVDDGAKCIVRRRNPGDPLSSETEIPRPRDRQVQSCAVSQLGMWSIFLFLIMLERFRPSWPAVPSWNEVQQTVDYQLRNMIEEGRPHPHKGAKDSTGRLGYVHDPTYVKRNQNVFNSSSVCSTPLGEGEEGLNGIKGLRKIQIARAQNVSARVLCIVYIHSNRHHVLESIVQTYAPSCDGFMAASNKTDEALGAVDIPHAGPEEYGNMWQKVRSTWSYVHDNYRNDYDWFHIGGDNMIVFPENLKLACSQSPTNKPLYMGGAMHRPPYPLKTYCGGGSGYTLNRAALNLLVETKLPTCWPYHVASDEDRIIAHCLSPEVKCHHSVDELDESRYHPLSPEYHSAWNLRKRAMWWPKVLKEHHGITATMKEQLDGISKTSVSFHLTANDNKTIQSDDGGLKRMYAIVHGLCDQK